MIFLAFRCFDIDILSFFWFLHFVSLYSISCLDIVVR